LRRITSESYDIENKPSKIHKKFSELQEEIDLGNFKNEAGQIVNITLTKDELIKRWMEFQDPTLEQSFREGNLFTDEIIEAINKEMTNQDKAFARGQFELYEKQWKKINPIYREFYGVDLPFNEFYSPIRRSGFKEDINTGFGEFFR